VSRTYNPIRENLVRSEVYDSAPPVQRTPMPTSDARLVYLKRMPRGWTKAQGAIIRVCSKFGSKNKYRRIFEVKPLARSKVAAAAYDAKYTNFEFGIISHHQQARGTPIRGGPLVSRSPPKMRCTNFAPISTTAVQQ